MVLIGLSKTRSDAVRLGKDFAKKLRLFHRATGSIGDNNSKNSRDNTFSDDTKMYEFRPEVLLSLLIVNMNMNTPMTIQKNLTADKNKKSKTSKKTEKSDDKRKKSQKPKKERHHRVVKTTKKQLRQLYPEAQVLRSEAVQKELKTRVASMYKGHHLVTDSPHGSYATKRTKKSRATTATEEEESYIEITVVDDAILLPPPSKKELEKYEEEKSYVEFTVIEGEEEDEEASYIEYTVVDDDDYDYEEFDKITPPTQQHSQDSPNDVQKLVYCEPNRSIPLKGGRRSSSKIEGEFFDILVPYLDDDEMSQLTMFPF